MAAVRTAAVLDAQGYGGADIGDVIVKFGQSRDERFHFLGLGPGLVEAAAGD